MLTLSVQNWIYKYSKKKTLKSIYISGDISKDIKYLLFINFLGGFGFVINT